MTSQNTSTSVLEIGDIIIEIKPDFNLAIPLCELMVLSKNRDISSTFTLNPKNMIKIANYIEEQAKKLETEWEEQAKK